MIRDGIIKDTIISDCCITGSISGEWVSFRGYDWFLFEISFDGLEFGTDISRCRGQDVDNCGRLLVNGVDEI